MVARLEHSYDQNGNIYKITKIGEIVVGKNTSRTFGTLQTCDLPVYRKSTGKESLSKMISDVRFLYENETAKYKT